MKSGNLNFLEPSGSLQACNGIALPFVMKSGNLNFLELSGSLQACNGIALSFFAGYHLVMTTGQWVLLIIVLTCYLPDHLWEKVDFEIDILPVEISVKYIVL